jgi:hypothetical protein
MAEVSPDASARASRSFITALTVPRRGQAFPTVPAHSEAETRPSADLKSES